jgi:hypothetical protein
MCSCMYTRPDSHAQMNFGAFWVWIFMCRFWYFGVNKSVSSEFKQSYSLLVRKKGGYYHSHKSINTASGYGIHVQKKKYQIHFKKKNTRFKNTRSIPDSHYVKYQMTATLLQQNLTTEPRILEAGFVLKSRIPLLHEGWRSRVSQRCLKSSQTYCSTTCKLTGALSAKKKSTQTRNRICSRTFCGEQK